MKQPFILIMTVLLSLSLSGCGIDTDSDPDFEGYVLKADNEEILLAKDVSSSKFEAIKNKSVSEFRSDFDGPDDVGLVYISYDDAKQFEKGDEIKAWVDGVNDSYPQQAGGEKIVVKD